MKRDAQLIHARRRGLERYGVRISEKVNCQLVERIQRGQAKFVRQACNAYSSVFDVDYAGEVLRCVYDRRRKVIATVLPREAA